MSLRLYLLIMSVMTAFCWLVFGYIIWTVNPQTTNGTGFFLFYLSLFLALAGTAAIIGFVARFVFLKRELVINTVITAFRQSFLFSALLTAALFLSARGLLTWLNLLILIIGLSLLEFFLLSYNKAKDAAVVEKQPDEL